ncbi:MAG: SDR family oxidoreductase [Actinomycetota bacterium]|nr:SDR family oxidoreductase [Actinomycetota bacterium]
MSIGTVLVTGGASGLGAAVVAAVTEAGGRAVVLDRVAPDSDGTHAPAEHVIVDLLDRRAAERAVRELAERLGGIDAVVTCAGIDSCGRLEDVPADEWDRVVEVNLLGTVAVIRAALPGLRARGGRVVTIASTLGLRALSDATAYCASKFAIVGFTRALAAETAGQIGVTMMVPGGMQTPFFDGRDEQYKPPPDAKLNRPGDVAAAIVFALSQPRGCEIRELVITPSVEGSWP